MFERRLKILLALLGAFSLLALARMAELQLVYGHVYRQEAGRMMLRPLQLIPAVRGRILDRRGVVLASEEPSWSVCVHYGLLADNDEYVAQLARARGEGVAALDERVARMWRQLVYLSDLTGEELQAKRDRLIARVARVRQNFAARHGYETTVLEEVMLHPIIADLDDQAQVNARLVLGDTPGTEVRDGSTRRYLEHPAFGHLLGRLGEVSPEDLDDDPHADDMLRRYRAGDLRGTAGVECRCEEALRGRRGQVIENRDGIIVKRIEPKRGDDVMLSIDAELQRRVYDRLIDAIDTNETASGGAAVILDAASRQVLALVSAPGFRPGDFRRRYDELLADTVSMPLRFRALATLCAPGSIVKPTILAAALATETVTPEFTVNCQGALFPSRPDVWREWRSYRTGEPMHHGTVNGETSLKDSCNVFFYTVGEMLGPARVCEWLQMFGLGKPAGTGLLEEAVGVVPTGAWLRRERGRSYRIADGRNYALGQGEILVNSVQAANLAASYATGLYMPVSLVINDGSERGVWTLPVSNRTWNIVRRGMWRVVNEQGGTASLSVRLTSDAYEICGKSGSAQASRRAVAYEARWVDANLSEQRQIVPATNRAEAARRVRQDVLNSGAEPDDVQYEVARWWPGRSEPEEGMPTHAWFVGFVQEKSDGHRFTHPRIAFAVMLEYGGSGGRHSGPVAADIVQMIIDEFPQYLGAAGSTHRGLVADN